MKIVRLRGGLGNQLFGLAFAHSVMRLCAEPVAIDVSGFRRDRYGRAFITGDLAGGLGLEAISRSSAVAVLRWLPLPGRVAESLAPSDLAAFADRGRRYDGYWQDERYIFEAETIRKRTRAFLDSKSTAADPHDIVIHRRGYGEETVPSRRGGPAPDYVARATDLIERTLGRTRDIVVISDAAGGADPFADMAVLLRARALVLANSSYSWWAGYCGDAHVVTYPQRHGAFHYPTPARRFALV